MNNLELFKANPLFAKRFYKEEEHPIRSKFERDRDRILYSKEFRRLNRKTQVFVAGFDDHVRNRLTHTIEVAQISQTIAKHLGLDETLAQAIAYGHDVGHTPFGHVGERTLNYFMNGCGNYRDFTKVDEKYRGFKHNWQGIRVVTELEKVSDKFIGLNLTDFVLWGILNHTGIKPKPCEYKNKNGKCNFQHKNLKCHITESDLLFSFYEKYLKYHRNETSWTIEALIVRIADEIAQRHHDIEDGLYAGIIKKDELVLELLKLFTEELGENEINSLSNLIKEQNTSVYINSISKIIINFLVTNVIENTKINLHEIKNKYQIETNEDFYEKKPLLYNDINIFDIVNYPNQILDNEKQLQNYLKSRILNSHIAQRMDGKATYILRNIIKAYLDNPQQLPDSTIHNFYMRYYNKEHKIKLLELTREETIGYLRDKLKTDHSKINSQRYRSILLRTICDFIAGMTDDFAIQQYNNLYGTSNVFNNY